MKNSPGLIGLTGNPSGEAMHYDRPSAYHFSHIGIKMLLDIGTGSRVTKSTIRAYSSLDVYIERKIGGFLDGIRRMASETDNTYSVRLINEFREAQVLDAQNIVDLYLLITVTHRYYYTHFDSLYEMDMDVDESYTLLKGAAIKIEVLERISAGILQRFYPLMPS